MADDGAGHADRAGQEIGQVARRFDSEDVVVAEGRRGHEMQAVFLDEAEDVPAVHDQLASGNGDGWGGGPTEKNSTTYSVKKF